MTSILLSTRKPYNNWHLSCYPQESHHALSMHSHPCIIHAFKFHALSMHSILLSTRNIIIHLPCIIHALCIHALSMQQSCYPQEHNHALSMHSHSCTTHAFTFLLLFTRAHMHYFPCIANRASSFILIFTRSQARHNIYLVINKITIP